MRRLVLASLRGNSRRLVAGGIAIVLSVGFLSAVLFAMDSAKAHITEKIGSQYTVADTVLNNATEPDVAERLSELDQVQAATRLATGFAQVSAQGQDPKNSALSGFMTSVPTNESMRWQQSERGRLPERPDEIAVTEELAEENDLAVGDTLVFSVQPDSAGTERDTGDDAGKPQRATVVGTVAEPGQQNAQLFTTDKGVDDLAMDTKAEVLVRGSLDGVSEQRLHELGGDKAEAVTVEEKVETTASAITGGVNIFGAMLLGFAGIALFVALLVVTNTFTIVLAQRARELALYRCVGAARNQVFGAVVVESLVLGVLASLLGLLVGAGIAIGAIALLGNLTPELDDASLAVSPTSAVGGLLVGTVVTVLASLAPARRATQVAPLAALRPELALRVRSAAGAFRLVAGALLLLAGGALMAFGIRLGTPETAMLLGVSGGALSFLGVLLFGPILAPAVVRLLGLFARLGGVPGRVSVTNAVRNPRRTAATTSALLVGVTLITMLTVGAATSQRTTEQTMDEEMPLDLVLSVDQFQNEGSGLAPGTVQTARDTEGLETLAVERGVTARVDDNEIGLNAVPLDEAREIARNPGPLRGFDDGVLLLGPSQSDSIGARQGDTVSVQVGERERDFEVAIASDQATPEALITAADLQALDGENRAEVTGIWARFADDLTPGQLNDRLESLQQADSEATVAGSAPSRMMYQQIVDIALLVAVALLGMAVLIALLGIGNTLSLSVLERIRENALLRALGLTRGQLRGTLAIESALISGAAVVLGLILGTAYGYLGTSTLFAGLDNMSITLDIPVRRVLLIAAVGLTAGVVASVLPARTAANTPPARVL